MISRFAIRVIEMAIIVIVELYSVNFVSKYVTQNALFILVQ